MPVIAVVNRKGGSGKSTLATHVAAWLSLRGDKVMLGDVDKQRSTVPWLRRRSEQSIAGEPLIGFTWQPDWITVPGVMPLRVSAAASALTAPYGAVPVSR